MDPDLSNGLVIAEYRHHSVRHFGPLFAFGHLNEDLRPGSERFAGIAQYMIDVLPDGHELVAGLRKLLEAKDCFVRAAL